MIKFIFNIEDNCLENIDGVEKLEYLRYLNMAKNNIQSIE
jgi:hypothetical protein